MYAITLMTDANVSSFHEFMTMPDVKAFLEIVPESCIPNTLQSFTKRGKVTKLPTPKVKCHPAKVAVFTVTYIKGSGVQMVCENYILPDDEHVHENASKVINFYRFTDRENEIVSIERVEDGKVPDRFVHSYNKKLNEHGERLNPYDVEQVKMEHCYFKKNMEKQLVPFIHTAGACLFNARCDYIADFAKSRGNGTCDCYTHDGEFVGTMKITDAMEWLGGCGEVIPFLDI